MKFKLGEILKDRVTGFTGVVMGRTEYFTGCIHYGLQATKLKDGAIVAWEWLDEQRLDATEKRVDFYPEYSQKHVPIIPTSGPFQSPSSKHSH
jgi:hypothetical protein